MYSPSSILLSAVLRFCLRRPILFFVPVIFGLIVTGTFDKNAVENRADYKNLCPYGCYGIPVTFTFDDGYASQYTNAYPIIQKFNEENGVKIPATVYIITSMVGQDDRMTLEQITTLYNAGWEIGSHTVTHPDLTTLSQEDLQEELVSSKEWLERNGFQVYTIAAPFGAYDDSVVEAMKPLYYGHRTVTTGLNDIPLATVEDAYRLQTVSFEGKMSLSEAERWVDKAFAEHKWLIFTMHRVQEPADVPVEARKYTTDPDDLEAILQYILETAQEYEIRFTDYQPTELPAEVPLPLKP